MRANRGALPLAVLALSFSEAEWAKAGDETNRELVRFSTAVDLERGDLTSAELGLREHLTNDSDDPQAWRLFALVLSRQGRAPAAEKALARATALAPEADRLEVSKLLDASSDAATSARAGLASRHRAIFGFQSGYDTNVLLLNDSTLSDGGSDSGQVSPSLSPSLRFSRVYGSESRPLKWDTSSSYTWYSESSAKTFNTLAAQTSLARGNWALDGDITFLNLEGFGYFTWAGTAAYKPEKVWKSFGKTRWNSGTGYRKYSFDEGDDVSSDRSGIFVYTEFQQRFQWGGFGLQLTPRYDHQFARGDRYKIDRVGFGLALSQALSPKWETRLSAEPAALFYPKSDQGRSDRLLTSSFTLGWRPGENWTWGASYTGLRNVSTLSSAQYTKHQAGLVVMRAL
jgi:hypothetical protein